MADFTSWARPTLERLATELQADNQRLRETNEELQAERREALAAWRAEVRRNDSTELNLMEESDEPGHANADR